MARRAQRIELDASGGAASYYAWTPKPGIRMVGIDTLCEGGVVGPAANGNIDDPQFRWLTASNLAFFLAMGSQGVVRPYLAYHFTKDPFLLGLVSFAVALPMLLLSPFGGVAADRVDRRKLIWIWTYKIVHWVRMWFWTWWP